MNAPLFSFWLLFFSQVLQAQIPAVRAFTESGHSLSGITLDSTRNYLGELQIRPEKKDNPLNGVTTYDLVLISKHILGIEALDSPYKMIAADANKSRSITTFDIVELRKLILGLYTELPNNTSWRFVDMNYLFPDSLYPFQTLFPEAINCIAPPNAFVDFVGIKVGDCNNSAVANRPAERPLLSLEWPGQRARPGETFTLPIRYTGNSPLDAIQLGLRFDPSLLQLIGPSLGDIETYLPANFNLLNAAAGEIRTLWLPMSIEADKIQPGDVLFYLSFKALADIPESAVSLWLDNQLLDCAAWSPEGAEYALNQAQPTAVRSDAQSAAAAIRSLQATARPNPTADGATLSVRAERPGKARVALLDAFGNRISMREVSLVAGQQDIPLPDMSALPAGVYFWSIFTPAEKAQGHLIKQ